MRKRGEELCPVLDVLMFEIIICHPNEDFKKTFGSRRQELSYRGLNSLDQFSTHLVLNFTLLVDPLFT